MTITMQYNKSEPNRVQKTIDDVSEKTGVLREGTSIIDPVILVEGDLSDFATVNYMTIPDFSRSYFVRGIKSVRTGLVEISAHCDVLSSFAPSILANKAIIKKQEKAWNLYLNDGTFKVYQNPTVALKAFPTGFTTQQFVLAVAGG